MSDMARDVETVLIEIPHKNDVLFGRGGGINSHPGNRNYRSIVHHYKRDYNLAGNKQLKADISNTVIDKILALKPPGRFLAKSKKNAKCWERVTPAEAMKKTSQALREGAPDIRARAIREGSRVMNRYAAREVDRELAPTTRNSRKQREPNSLTSDDGEPQKRLRSDTSTTTKEMIAGNMIPVKAGNHAMTVAMEQAEKSLASHNLTQAALWAADAKIKSLLDKKGRSVSIQSADNQQNDSVNLEGQHNIVDQMAETPPISPRITASANTNEIPSQPLDSENPLRLPTTRTKISLRRMHSLATSDTDPSEGFHEPFTNPFEVEGEQLNHTTEIPLSNKKLLRDISVTDVNQVTFSRGQSNRALSSLYDLNGLSERSQSLRRLNSLALSDLDNIELNNADEPFLDPFRDESLSIPGKKVLKRQGTDRSLTSELSDLPEFKKEDNFDIVNEDYGGGIRTIYDASNSGCLDDSLKDQRLSSASRLFGSCNNPSLRTSSNIVEDSQ